MKTSTPGPVPATIAAAVKDETGFSLMEFMMSSLVLLVVAASSFGVLTQTERTADSQRGTQSVTENARIAMETITRIIQQAGNNPKGISFTPITILGAGELHVSADLTGSAGTANPDKGDPDGDIQDAWEDVTIRHNEDAGTLELVTGSIVHSIAGNISAFSMQYFDSSGHETTNSSDVQRVRITMTVSSPQPDPQTNHAFNMQISSDVQIALR